MYPYRKGVEAISSRHLCRLESLLHCKWSAELCYRLRYFGTPRASRLAASRKQATSDIRDFGLRSGNIVRKRVLHHFWKLLTLDLLLAFFSQVPIDSQPFSSLIRWTCQVSRVDVCCPLRCND